MFINAFEGLDVSIKDLNPRLQDEKMIFQQVQATIDITIGSASAEGRKWSIRSPLRIRMYQGQYSFQLGHQDL